MEVSLVGKVTQYSAVNLIAEARVDPEVWSRIPDEKDIVEAVSAIESHGLRVIRVDMGEEALAAIVRLIPAGAEVMHGSSTTLIEIGYEDLIQSGKSWWNDMHKAITAENDDLKRAELRRKSVTSEYFLSSANAIAKTGEILACDMGGSRTGAWPFAAGHLILVAGVNKIVPTLEDAMKRIREYAYPLEDARALHAYGIHSRIGKCVILAYEASEGRTTLILVNDRLGY
jgi:hypothetical protein